MSPGSKCVSFFAALVPEHILERLFSWSKNPIHELEVLLVLLAAINVVVRISFKSSDSLVHRQ